MNNEQILSRIQELTLEQKVLQDTHAAQVQQNQKANQEFQQKVVENQTRYAQITGGIAELRKLVQQPTQKDINNDNLPTPPSIHHRFADVCPVEQSQDR